MVTTWFDHSLVTATGGSSTRTLADRFADTLDARDFGVAGGGVVNETAALQAAFTAAAGKRLLVPPGTYKFSQLTIPASVTLLAAGATFASDGSLTGSAVTVTVGANCAIDEFVLTTPGTETNTDVMTIGIGTQFERLIITATAQRAGGGITTTGQDVQIGYLETTRIDRPFAVNNPSTTTPTTGCVIGFFRCRSYVRGLKFTHAYGFTVGGYDMATKSANAAVSPGHNGILISGCSDWTICSGVIADSGEHAFRVGGVETGGKTWDWNIGHLRVVRSGGCALKINPNQGELCRNGSVAGVHGIDVGNNSLAGNKELLRLTRYQDIRIGYAVSYLDAASTASLYALQVNAGTGLWIGTLGGTLNSGINISQTSDADGVSSFGGAVTKLYVDRFVGTTVQTNAIVIAMSSFGVGEIHIRGIDLTGHSGAVLSLAVGTLSGDVVFEGRIWGAVVPSASGAPADDRVRVDLRYGDARYTGRAANINFGATARQQWLVPAFTAANAAANQVFLNASLETAALNAYGGAVEFSRLGSTRRGAAIATKQTGANAYNMGLAILAGSNVTATDALNEVAVIDHSGNVAALGTVTAPTFAGALTGNASTATALAAGSADRIKLDGIAAGATLNATDAALRDRTTHTGSQATSTITGLDAALLLKAPLAGPTFTGTAAFANLTASGAASFAALAATGAVELGAVAGIANTPYIDFHSGAVATDYDSRIIASGGTGTLQQGTLTYQAASHVFDGAVSATKYVTTAGAVLTIAAGVVTVTHGYHALDTEAAAATDDLDTINGGSAGMTLILRAANDARDVVLKDATGNLRLNGDFTLTHTDDRIVLLHDGVAWAEISRNDATA